MNEERIIPYQRDCVSYTQYARDVERVITQMDESLCKVKYPELQIMDFMKMAAVFYDGDWAGILDADLTMKLWSASWWYNRRTDGMTPNSFGDLEEGDYLNTWINSLRSGKKIVINDIEEWKEKSPAEYLFFETESCTLSTGHSILETAYRFLNRPQSQTIYFQQWYS